MNKFRKPHGGNRDGRKFDRKAYRPDFGARPAFRRDGNKGFGKPEKYDAVCSHCGKTCQVPFRPNGKKPVYCSDCFNSDRGTAPTRFPRENSGNRDFSTDSFENRTEDTQIADLKRQVNAMNAKIDTILRILENAPAARPPFPPKTGSQENIRTDIVKKRIAKKGRMSKK